MENTRPTFRNCAGSSWVKYIQYDEEKKVMILTAKNGQVIHYKDFTDEMWDGCLAAESIGKYIHSEIKPLYQHETPEEE